MSNPNRRRRPVWCGDVDTTRPGGAWDVQDDGCCGPCKPPVPGCGPGRPPMPQFPDCGYHIPPVQYVPGMNEQEQLANLNNKMNELIEMFNCNTDKVYGAYEEVVRSAVCNDAFYKEITVESGYLADASTSYELVHIPFVDCAGQPIYMEMGLAYNNTTNSGVTESVFDKALEVYADKILPAAERGFQGVTIWKGAPIYSGETHVGARALIPGDCDYTLGVTENGYFKIYDTPNDKDNSGMIKTMRQDKVRNSMGCAVIIRGGEYVVDENLEEMELPCTVMAMNYKTKERFILAIGKDNVASDITPEMIANLLKKYDVDVAALTSWGQQSYLLDKGQFSFMPTSTDSDGIPTVPQSAAFWYITKRRNFHNDYVKEVAALTIQMGENLWYDELTSESVDNLKLDFVELRNNLEQEIQDRKDADEALGERIDTEIADREAADTALDEKYAAEVARLDGEIDTLEQRVTDEVTRLDALIQTTKEALTAKDVKEVKVTHEGTRDTYQVVLNDGTVLGADVIVYNYDQLVQKLDNYATVEQRLDAEIQARKDADDALNALITAEQQARANGDTALGEQIASVRTELTELIEGNTTDITALQGALDTLTQTVQSNYTSLNERVTSNAENIANLQGSYGALQATVAALNETVTGLQQSFASTEQSFENVKQTVNEMQTELNQFESAVEGKYLYVGEDGFVKNTDRPLSTKSTIVDNIAVKIGNIENTAVRFLQGLYISPEDGYSSFIGANIAKDNLENYLGVASSTNNVIKETQLDHHSLAFIQQTDEAMYSVGLSFDVNEDSDSEFTMYIDGKYIKAKPTTPGATSLTISNLGDPSHELDVANKRYVDNKFSAFAGEYLPLTGGTLTGPLDVAQSGAVPSKDGLYHYAVNDYAFYSYYADEERPARKFARFGVGEPVNDSHAATKKYVDTVGSNLAEEISSVGGQFDNYLPLSGGTLSGDLDITTAISFHKTTVSQIQGSGVPFIYSAEMRNAGEHDAVICVGSNGANNFTLLMGGFTGDSNVAMYIQHESSSIEPDTVIFNSKVGGTYDLQSENYLLACVRGHDPRTADDFATKRYVDNLAATAVKVTNQPWSKGVLESVNNFIVNTNLVTGFGVSNGPTGNATNLTANGLQVVEGQGANQYVTGAFEANTFYITGKNSGYGSSVADAGIFISYYPGNNDSVPIIYGRAVRSNQSIKRVICFSEDGGFDPTDNFTRLIGIDYPVNDHDAATKGYVDNRASKGTISNLGTVEITNGQIEFTGGRQIIVDNYAYNFIKATLTLSGTIEGGAYVAGSANFMNSQWFDLGTQYNIPIIVTDTTGIAKHLILKLYFTAGTLVWAMCASDTLTLEMQFEANFNISTLVSLSN